MESRSESTFQSLSTNVGTFSARDKTFLIPQMNRIGCRLIAAVFQAFGVRARVMDTYRGMDLGREFTSGKECFPCQVTTGDILQFLEEEQERLGETFNPDDYIYFMPEAGGPCRFGMYNKFQRIVLDSFPALKNLKIGSLTSDNAYSPAGIIEKEKTTDFRKASYLSVVVADILDRLLWRIRPYEREPGLADSLIDDAVEGMSEAFLNHGADMEFDAILDRLEDFVRKGKDLMDPGIPRKPLIGVVGEIYLRTHTQSNQDVIKVLEHYGAEVVNASIAEWVNYTAYDRMREARIGLARNLRLFRICEIRGHLSKIFSYGANLFYQQKKQDQVYKRLKPVLDLHGDHRVGDLEKVLVEKDLFSFDVGTEACLSVAGIMEYMMEGYNGVVNVYPFTCMPSTITSAIVRPIVNRHRLPYLDTAYDGTYQPGREAAIRTFMYQAQQHKERASK
jgi:predicted nucleotide-binding protein (sugar kinase/HSP70/actin superfamily)